MISALPTSAAVRTAAGAVGGHESSMAAVVVAAACGIWVLVIILVQLIGFTQLSAKNF